MQIMTRTPEETASLGARIADALSPGDVVFLIGGLGAGKSVLARGIAAGLGVNRSMPSPTFTLMRPYQGRVAVYHFDLYRLENGEEFEMAGLFDPLGGDGVALIEWPDQIGLDWPCALTIRIAQGAEEAQRLMALDWPDPRAEALFSALGGQEAVR